MFELIKGSGPISFPGLGFEINPPKGFILFDKLNIHFYGVIIAIGLILAVVYGMRRSKHFGLKQDDILDGVLWIVPVAIICARLYYVIFQWDMYKDDPISMLYIWNGGLAIYGGVIGAAVCVVVHCKIKKISLGAVLDLVALGFLLGQGIGNRVIGLKEGKVCDFDIQEALSMKKPYDEKLHHIAEQIAF